MPILHLDREAAGLLIVSAEMLAAALRLRTERADPDKIISDSLTLQSNKLATALIQLAGPDPREFDAFTEEEAQQIAIMGEMMATSYSIEQRKGTWRRLRAMLLAAPPS